jgi:sialate O-acetylesterase
MVIQQNAKIKLWGKADEGERFDVAIRQNSKIVSEAITNAQAGKWKVELYPLKSRPESFEISIKGNNLITLKNILIGETWIVAGQSNMQSPLMNAENTKVMIADAANRPDIRIFFQESAKPTHEPRNDVFGGHWDVGTSDKVKRCSAIGYCS